MSFLNAGEHSFDLNKKTYVMGIVNLTPDSFSDGGKYSSPEKALKRIDEITLEGADIIDIGAQSTRPGFKKISADEEWQRLEPVIKNLKTDIPVSVDTFYPEIAEKALNCGVSILNDVSGFQNEKMFEIARKSSCALIINHPFAGVDVKSFFENKLAQAKKHKISENRICFDPGIGFNKSREEDAMIIANIKRLKISDCALLVGISRKRIVAENCGNPPPAQRLWGTIAANTAAILSGANIIRVHDVKEAVQAAKVTDAILKYREVNL